LFSIDRHNYLKHIKSLPTQYSSPGTHSYLFYFLYFNLFLFNYNVTHLLETQKKNLQSQDSSPA